MCTSIADVIHPLANGLQFCGGQKIPEDLHGENSITQKHIDNNAAVRKMLVERGIISENLLAAEDVKKVERRLESEQKKVFGKKKI